MPSLGSYLLETAVTLAAVVLLALVLVYGGRKLGLGGRSGPIELVGRLPLEARRAVYLVRVGRLVYIVGASEAGLVRLGEIEEGSLPSSDSIEPDRNFRDVLARVVGRSREDRTGTPARADEPSRALEGEGGAG